jgi:hypothetical protein
MSTTKIENIIGLINSSPILSLSERADWLALLGLMNDKQLLELEKILSENQKSAQSVDVPPHRMTGAEVGTVSRRAAPSDDRGESRKVGKSEVGRLDSNAAQNTRSSANTAVAKPLVPSSPSLPQMPKMSHIMNLPTFKQPSAPLPVKPPVEKKPSIFASKLKAIFKEKELPAGHPEFELELPAKSLPSEHSSETVVGKKTDALETQENKKPPVIPKPFFPLAEKPAAGLATDKPLLSKPPVLLRSSAKTPASPGFASGINFPEVTEASKSQSLAGIKEHLQSTGTILKEIHQPIAIKEPMLNGLEDLTKLVREEIQVSALDSMVAKIKQLIGRYGYFEAVFNIEKSKIYEDYINTGATLLTGQSDFETLAEQGEDYLTREQFEKFTDLLAKIQAS